MVCWDGKLQGDPWSMCILGSSKADMRPYAVWRFAVPVAIYNTILHEWLDYVVIHWRPLTMLCWHISTAHWLQVFSWRGQVPGQRLSTVARLAMCLCCIANDGHVLITGIGKHNIHHGDLFWHRGYFEPGSKLRLCSQEHIRYPPLILEAQQKLYYGKMTRSLPASPGNLGI